MAFTVLREGNENLCRFRLQRSYLVDGDHFGLEPLAYAMKP